MPKVELQYALSQSNALPLGKVDSYLTVIYALAILPIKMIGGRSREANLTSEEPHRGRVDCSMRTPVKTRSAMFLREIVCRAGLGCRLNWVYRRRVVMLVLSILVLGCTSLPGCDSPPTSARLSKH